MTMKFLLIKIVCYNRVEGQVERIQLTSHILSSYCFMSFLFPFPPGIHLNINLKLLKFKLEVINELPVISCIMQVRHNVKKWPFMHASCRFDP